MEQALIYALKNKLRFKSQGGNLSLEDLYDLPLVGKVSLDTIAIDVSKDIEASQVIKSFVLDEKEPVTLVANRVRLTILQHLIKEKMEHKKAAEESVAIKQHNEQIQAIIDQKRLEERSNLTIEELEALKK